MKWLLPVFILISACSSSRTNLGDPDQRHFPSTDLPPSPPSALSGTAMSPTRIALQWTEGSDDIAISEYAVYRDGIFIALSGGQRSYEDVAVSAGRTYSYQVSSIDSTDQESELSDSKNITTPTNPTIDNPPDQPIGLQGTVIGSNEIKLDWMRPADDHGIDSIKVFRDGALLVTVGDITTYSDRSVAPGRTYRYKIQAIDSAGQSSPFSVEISATTPSLDMQPPTLSNGRINGQPSGASFPSGTQTVQMQVTTNEAATCKYGTLSNQSYSSMGSQFTITGNTTHTVSLTSLQDGRTYVYYARCRDMAGNENPATPAFSVTFSVNYSAGGGDDLAWSVMDQNCLWCHTAANPTGGFNLSTHAATPALIDGMEEGITEEMAPLMKRLSAGDKSILLDFITYNGGTVPPSSIPTHFDWSLNTVLTPLTNGYKIADGATSANPTRKAPAFAWVHEDTFIDHDAWTVKTISGVSGINKAVCLDQHRQTPDNPSGSHNPSSYLVFKGLPYHGRFYNSKLEGDVLFGRWMSVGLHAVDMKPPLRDDRKYVRLQFDRDAISLRSFPKTNSPSQNETSPWCTGYDMCAPCADQRLSGNVHSCQYLSTAWRHFVLEARTQPNGDVRWTAVVTNRSTGAVIANFTATEPASMNPLKGVFFLHAYSTNNDPDRCWANLQFSADVDPS